MKNLQSVLSSTHTVRPEEVIRAKKLVQDKDYPSRAILESVAWMFSAVLIKQDEHGLRLQENPGWGITGHSGSRDSVR